MPRTRNQRARDTALNGVSKAYLSYGQPELSDQLDKRGRPMIAYPCKMCPKKISRPTSDSSCSNLNKHAAICIGKKNQSETTRSLAALGITGTGLIEPKEVPQLCAVWCAEAARPFSALVDASHKAILHPTVIKYLPTRKAVSKDIHKLYSAIQEQYRVELQAHKGALYLGADVWQSPNGVDILGVVIYRLKERGSGPFELEAMPLDFIRLSRRHTGEYMAESVCLVVEKFGIQDKVHGLVTDNASNNEVMVRELKRLKWPHFKGKTHWIRCFAHILNLIVQTILRPFGAQKKKKNSVTGLATDEHSGSASEDDDPTGQIQILAPEEELNSGPDEDSSAHELGVDLDDEDEYLSEGDLEEGSEEDEEQDRYTSASCKQTLAKVNNLIVSLYSCILIKSFFHSYIRAIAKKLRYSPNAKAEFVASCVAKGCKTPHNISRDVRTRWNSTNTQLQSVIRCEDAISTWQRHKRHGVERKYHLDDSDFDLARDLVQVLQLFYEITLQVSIASSARVSNIVVFIDQITDHLSTVVKATTKYPPALRNACRAGLKLTNKYYSLTDESPVYRIAILLHPSFNDEYFKLAAWEPDWITEAIRLARDMWTTHYKPRALNVPSTSRTATARPQATGMLAGLSSAAAARGGNNSSDPLDIWLSGGLILEDHEPVNPLKWWIQQKRAGNTHGGLVHMALDILSCPERAFSFGRDYVTPKRHRLAHQSVSRGMAVAFYSKNNKIAPGVLSKWKEGCVLEMKAKQKGIKRKRGGTCGTHAGTAGTLSGGTRCGMRCLFYMKNGRVPGSTGAIFSLNEETFQLPS
ncbi:hypothetical protein PSTG_08645 [Puccinia striiformis f. sp. tritici PST-78]|uniref:HAT C-terminal dimerisation domain-containing protein n=1 Tax=Puccinia striiformis f. sp. tritici PST-78 TaxID=1165861 RepID=A0A0L0VFF4_9BASI|nr:hypothetical protein PSTG_08645 [Puccinia striiformis f. sp. tritici PST-78]